MVHNLILTDDDKTPTEVSFQRVVFEKKNPCSERGSKFSGIL